MNSIEQWLRSIDLERYAQTFADNEVDLRTLEVLNEDDLKELGIPFGPRKRMLSAIAELQQAQPVPDPGSAAPASAASSSERRQLTALFCDMVGFTEIAHRVDPEVLQSVVRCYEEACTACIVHYGGSTFQVLGDGVVAFFGYPLAHEGETERAIRAGLEILQKMEEMDVPEIGRIRVRIAVATGIVVVSSAELGAVGETLNLAARLQTVAAPGTLIVSERVYRIAGGRFVYEDIGEHALKGISEPVRAYRVVGVAQAASRFDATVSGELTPLVGRENELRFLLDRGATARSGAGQAVLLTGEPGIGKSRILNAVCERLQAEGATIIRLQCSPFYVSSAFYPVLGLLEKVLDFSRDETPASRLDKLEALVARYGLPTERARFLARVLSIPCDERFGPLNISAKLARIETNRTLIDLLRAVALSRPVLMLFEDLHWADPTTTALLDMLMDQIGDIPILLLLTSRPEFVALWSEHASFSALDLGRLNSVQSRALISKVAGAKNLPPELLAQIVAKTDGVPLFVEELTRAILESGELIDEGDRYVFKEMRPVVSIPETIRDSLTARLDRAPAVKEIAQISAAVGREFSYELLDALHLMPEATLRRKLALLVESGLVLQRGTIPQAMYTFKHALVQEVAYDSMLRSRRQPLHAAIAGALENRFPETKETEPELIAHHYTEAGHPLSAVPFWRRAGELAMSRFALMEASAHLRRGLDLLSTMPATTSRNRMELGLRTSLAPVVVAQRGWGHPEVGSVLEPAWELAEALESRTSYLPLLNALWVHYMCRDQLALSLKWADRMRTAGEAAGDSSLCIVGERAASASCFWRGDFLAAKQHGDAVRSLYDARQHVHIAQLTNADPLTGEGVYRGQYLWMLGYPDQAVAATLEKDEHARRRNHPFDLAFALTLGAQVFDFLCEPAELLLRTEEAERVGREHGLSLLWEVMGEISKGIAWLRDGRVNESVMQLAKAVSRIAATGHRIWIWYLRALQAEGMARMGDLPGASALINESVERVRSGEDRAHYAEILRLRGWILMQQRRDMQEAERCLRKSIEVARSQQAKSWELRSSTTLAHLLAQRGSASEGHALLRPAYDWFTEGFGTRDLRDARAFLDS